MTENDIEKIVNEVESRLEKKYKVVLAKENVGAVLKEPREKWFSDQVHASKSLMAAAFGNTVVAWQVWELIRKLTCVVLGKQYVRRLANDPNAEIVAEKLCQYIYDLTIEYSSHDNR